jgi:hypothetical protein
MTKSLPFRHISNLGIERGSDGFVRLHHLVFGGLGSHGI